MGKLDKQVVSLLENSETPLTLAEIADQIGKPSKTIFKILRKLFNEGKVDCDGKTRRYMLAKE